MPVIECQDCQTIEKLVSNLYDQIDTSHSVENNVTALVVSLVAAIASCGDSDKMLVLATEHLRKLSDELQNLDIWNQSIFPRMSHSELAEMLAKCSLHLPD